MGSSAWNLDTRDFNRITRVSPPRSATWFASFFMNFKPIGRLAVRNAVMAFVAVACLDPLKATDFHRDVQPLLNKYCFECHSGDEISGDVDFGSIATSKDIDESFELWESMVDNLRAHSMPPEDAPQPSEEERQRIERWYKDFVDAIEPRPAVFTARRLSVTEYRNTLRSVLGFDLEVDVMEAEQTVTQRSMVVKLLPEDPPGKSGFKNDTHENPLSRVIWDQYSYLVDSALEELFSRQRRKELERFVGPIEGKHLTPRQAETLVSEIIPLAFRRPISDKELTETLVRLEGKRDAKLTSSLKAVLESVLMSPAFIYRGLRVSRDKVGPQRVDAYELAERLSYFLWADMPDKQLMQSAEKGSLKEANVFHAEIDRMLHSPKASSLAEIFVTEWLSLGEIEHVSNNPPMMIALQSQPMDFVKYLINEDRPLIELIDSRVAFANRYTAKMYAGDAKQLKKDNKQRGIEQQAVPNQRIELQQAVERGGILTMPGVLAMNKGPILRGTWVLERILGEELPDPPANVGQVEPNSRGQKLTFRQRFEQHRENPSCAVCHDKIDPLGFALQAFDEEGQYVLASNYAIGKKQKKKNEAADDPANLDTSGLLPSGETFDGIGELKKILTTTQREAVIQNLVERMMAYAYCRKLTIHDMPIANSITKQMISTDGTWRELIHAIANSIPFRETIFSEGKS